MFTACIHSGVNSGSGRFFIPYKTVPAACINEIVHCSPSYSNCLTHCRIFCYSFPASANLFCDDKKRTENGLQQDVRAVLLQAAAEEFIKKGYKGASVRSICSNAGVTTGALYFFFQNKKDLFENIVKDTYKRLLDMLRQSRERELEDIASGEQTEFEIVEYLVLHRKEIRLLLECAGETDYGNFQALLEKKLREGFRKFFKKFHYPEADPALIRVLVKMRMAGYRELVYGAYSSAVAKKLVQKMRIYADAGFFALLKKN